MTATTDTDVLRIERSGSHTHLTLNRPDKANSLAAPLVAALQAAIDAAKTHLAVQFYIVRNDGLGRALADRLIAARARGVRVWFLYDSIGSSGLPKSYLARLRQAGVEVKDFRPSKLSQFSARVDDHIVSGSDVELPIAARHVAAHAPFRIHITGGFVIAIAAREVGRLGGQRQHFARVLAARINRAFALNTDDFCAHIGQHHRAKRPWANACQFDNADSL